MSAVPGKNMRTGRCINYKGQDLSREDLFKIRSRVRRILHPAHFVYLGVYRNIQALRRFHDVSAEKGLLDMSALGILSSAEITKYLNIIYCLLRMKMFLGFKMRRTVKY